MTELAAAAFVACMLMGGAVLDPRGQHLGFSDDNYQGGLDRAGGFHLGAHFSWRESGRDGQGVVVVRVDDGTGSDQAACRDLAEMACPHAVQHGDTTLW